MSVRFSVKSFRSVLTRATNQIFVPTNYCKKKKALDTRTQENPEFTSLESCVNCVETSRGFWLLINRLDKLFSKTLFLSCFLDFETCFVTIVLLQVESSPYYQGLSGVWCFQDRSWSP